LERSSTVHQFRIEGGDDSEDKLKQPAVNQVKSDEGKGFTDADFPVTGHKRTLAPDGGITYQQPFTKFKTLEKVFSHSCRTRRCISVKGF
jgi:hypothetical protein